MSPPFRVPPSVVNRCNLSPWAIGSHAFQENPQPLEIAGVLTTERRLFTRLDAIADSTGRSRVFHDYLSVKFRLHEWAEHQASARSILRSSYVQFLHAWGTDGNGQAGAVLKDWVQSRFGLPPTYHGGRVTDDPGALTQYHIDQVRDAAKTMGVAMQLDLLYTFCQYELARRRPGENWLTLFRGTHDPAEYVVRDRAPVDVAMVQLNTLSSFTADAEVAWSFGAMAWEVRIPMPKIVFFSGLLPPHMLGGEAEYLVLGGEYRVKTLLY